MSAEERPTPLDSGESVGVAAINRRIDRLAREREAIQDELDANERERDELIGKWNRNVADHNRHIAKLRLLLGAAEEEA